MSCRFTSSVELDLRVVELPVAELLPKVVDLAIGIERLRLLRLLRIDLEAERPELMCLWARVGFRLGRRPLRGEDHLGEAVFGGILRTRLHALEGFFLADLDRVLDQIANHRFDVPPDVAYLGELRGFDLHERRTRELGKPASDFGLTNAGRPDHDDVARRDLVAKVARHVLSSPAATERNGDCSLGLVLPNDVPIELANRFARGKIP